jgi:hypothetical protein
MEHFHHGFFVDLQNGAIRQCGCGLDARTPPEQATFAEKVSVT